MRCPNERLAILNRIKAVGRRNKVFNADTCIAKYMSEHFSYDWDECISSMVKKGQLTSDGKGGYSLV